MTISRNDKSNNNLIVGLSGASGAIYAIRLLEILKTKQELTTHLVISDAGLLTIKLETDYTVKNVENLADYVYSINNIAAPIASGSFKTTGMIVLPCSMKTPSGPA